MKFSFSNPFKKFNNWLNSNKYFQKAYQHYQKGDRSTETLIREIENNNLTNNYFFSKKSKQTLIQFKNHHFNPTPLPNFLNDKSIPSTLWRYGFIFVFMVMPMLIGFFVYIFQPQILIIRSPSTGRLIFSQTDWLDTFNNIWILTAFFYFILMWTFSWTFRNDMKFSGLFFILYLVMTYIIIYFVLLKIINIQSGINPNTSSDPSKTLFFLVFFITTIFIFIKAKVFTITLFYELRTKWFSILLWGLISGGAILLIGRALHINNYFSDNFSNKLFNSHDTSLPVLFIAVFCAPVIEELAYREGLYRLVKNKTLFLILGTLLFAYVHVDGRYAITYKSTQTSFVISQLPRIKYYLFGSFVFTAIYLFKRSVLYTIPGHFLNNVVASLSMLL
ncbi:CPBP family intramembrane glutamic endopeptidase [Mycoplasma sp. SG1]|uniref:CPBP family intramembrane glutamic endopeptidase n=1 Tax=Mycoplasma sp. SG1 TaxID=2810348 RepID=UPI0020251934|nr:CPBP family intramembrane glutamic endopeptidase [Mycoplasma sp. SG1]URM53015.1 CPBP family intramembrane metalloprotease [Mycoplasma sp. SG1]